MKKQIIFVVLFFAVLTLFAALTFFLPAGEFSDNENRVLAQMPELTADSLLSGEFQSGLDSFLSDQIPGRELWIRANTQIKKWLGKKEINGVYLGKDCYYFQQFTEDNYSSSRMSAIFSLIEEFAKQQNAPVTVMPVPTPCVVLKDKLPANAPIYDADRVWQSLQELMPGCQVIDLRQDFADADFQTFYRTDHHWTTQGAYLGYKAYLQAMGLTPKALESFSLQEVSSSFYGTIYSKTLDMEAKADKLYAVTNLPPLSVIFDGEDTGKGIYAQEFLDKKDKYAYFFGGNWGKVEIQTQANNGKHLLVIKDSFANSMIPYLLEEYERITMVDLRYFSDNIGRLIQQQQPTEILFLYEMTNLLTDTGVIKLAS